MRKILTEKAEKNGDTKNNITGLTKHGTMFMMILKKPLKNQYQLIN